MRRLSLKRTTLCLEERILELEERSLSFYGRSMTTILSLDGRSLILLGIFLRIG